MIPSGYITLQEAIVATPLSYLANRALLPNLLQLLLLFLVVLFDPYILKKKAVHVRDYRAGAEPDPSSLLGDRI